MKVLNVLVCLFCLSECAKPGLKLSASRKALQYVADKAVNVLKDKVTSIKLPDIKHNSQRVENVKIELFLNPQVNVSIDPIRGLTAEVKTENVKVSAKAGVKVWWYWLSDYIEVSMTSIRSSLTVYVSSYQGKPVLLSSSCSITVKNIGIKARGWFFNYQIQGYKNDIQNMIENEICKALESSINVEGNKLISEYNFVARLNGGILYDLQLTSKPLFTTDRVVSFHKGTALKDPQPSINPHAFSLMQTRMTSIALSEESLNSVCRAAHARNLFTTTYYWVDQSYPDILDMLSKEVKDNVYAVLKSDSPVVISITPNGTLFNMQYHTVFNAEMVLLKVRGNYTGRVRVWRENYNIKAKLSVIAHDIEYSTEFINSTRHTSTFLKSFLTYLIETNTNDMLEPGWPLPQIADVKYKNFQVQYADEEIMMGIEVV